MVLSFSYVRAEVEAYNVLDPGIRVAILKALCDIRVEVLSLLTIFTLNTCCLSPAHSSGIVGHPHSYLKPLSISFFIGKLFLFIFKKIERLK